MGKALQGGRNTGARIVSVMLAALLAATMLPAAGLQAAFADEPVERPATSGGDVALSGTSGGAAAAPQAPVAEAREDGMHVAGGLAYTVADGGLALAGFDGGAPAGALAVPAAVSVDGKETPIVAIDLAEGQAADEVVALSLPQGVKGINTATLASAFPNLLSVEIAAAAGSSLPAAAGAASMRAAYSASGGMLFRPASVTVQTEDGLVESIECKELVWAPPALVSARIPVECRAIAEGAFADVRELKTVVAFGAMARIAEGALTPEQMEAAKVVVPQASAAVTDAERVSASMALMGDEGQKERRSAWHEAGWRTDDIVMGKPYGSLTEAVAVTDEGQIERDELQLVSYPGAHENAMDLKKPNADGIVEQAESGLAFTVKSDMTASVAWQGDKTATPAHIDVPSSVSIDGVAYPVTEIAAGAFEGAAFLTSVAIPEGVATIGDAAFANCANLAEAAFPATLKATGIGSFDGTQVDPPTPATATRAPQAATSGDSQPDGAQGAPATGAEGDSSGTAGDPEDQPVQGDDTTAAEGDEPTPPGDDGTLSGPDGEQPPPNDELMPLSDDSISSFSVSLPDSSSRTSARLRIFGGPVTMLKVIRSKNCSLSGTGDGFIDTTVPFFHLSAWGTGSPTYDQVDVRFHSADWLTVADMGLEAKSGYRLVGVSTSVIDKSTFVISVGIVREEAVGQVPLATTDLLSKSGETAFSSTSTVRGALNDLSGKLSKSGETAFSSTNTVRGAIDKKADKDVLSKSGEAAFTSTDTVRGALNAKVDASDFGTIAYSGLDGSDMSVYPTSYRKGGAPSLPKPEKPGSRFAGWTWSGHSTPTTDPNEIKAAFADGNKTVTLAANWAAPEATYFFAEDKPLDPLGTGTQEHDIFVKLSDSPAKLKTCKLKCDNSLGLFEPTTGLSSLRFGVGHKDAWNGNNPVNKLVDTGLALAEFNGYYGVMIRLDVPEDALNPSAFPSSLVSGSSVLECFEFEYELA